jgi:hypothetical protein
MEQKYWLSRSKAAGRMARDADTSEARLLHFEMAGRYSIKAAVAGAGRTQPVAVRTQITARPPQTLSPRADAGGEAVYYQQLETGARWLAARTTCAAERSTHLGMANRYAELRLDALPPLKR